MMISFRSSERLEARPWEGPLAPAFEQDEAGAGK